MKWDTTSWTHSTIWNIYSTMTKGSILSSGCGAPIKGPLLVTLCFYNPRAFSLPASQVQTKLNENISLNLSRLYTRPLCIYPGHS